MISVENREQIRRARLIEHKSVRAIAREYGHSRRTIKKALASAEGEPYTLRVGRHAPVLEAWKPRLKSLLAESVQQPRKQRYTARRIYELLQAEGYAGSASSVAHYVCQQRGSYKRPQVFLPLAWDAGEAAQVDWGEAQVDVAGERCTAQLFVMRACYSRRLFVRAYPHQRQEAFFEGHVEAFKYFGGVFGRLVYDNLRTAVQRVLEGHNRREQRAFVTLRSTYLFAAQFCNPGEGHEKGGVENGIGYVQRNFCAPVLEASDWQDLNAKLLARCQHDDHRIVQGQSQSIQAAWGEEAARLLGLPAHHANCCASHEVTPNGYGQVMFETNRYSVPSERVRTHLTLKAYPFRVEVLDGTTVLARHARCYGREQDVIEPMHYLYLLERSPGAFEQAKPMRQMRASWPAVYEQVLARMRHDDRGGIREFVRVLRLLSQVSMAELEHALQQALELNTLSCAAVQLLLHQERAQHSAPSLLDLAAYPKLRDIQPAATDLSRYQQLLSASTHPS